MEYGFYIGKAEHRLKIEHKEDLLMINLDGQNNKVRVISLLDNSIQLKIDNKKINASIAEEDGHFFVSIDGIVSEIKDADVSEENEFAKSKKQPDGDEVKAPMPGKVIKIFAKEGDSVAEGQKVAILEAMKMENELVSPRKGKIAKVLVKEGALVDAGQKIVEFKK